MNLFMDSGAPTLYNTMIRINKKSGAMGSSMADRRFDDFSFIETDRYKEYREEYIKYLQNNKHIITTYANLDVINNPEATWENQLLFESKGLNPIPVFHFGNDLKWLKMYIDKGYDYIAMGGLIPNSYSVLKTPLDFIWMNYLTDSKGMPIIKVHGFAVTSPRLLHRYPWYSSDSTSWVRFGMFGAIVVPGSRKGKYDYTQAPNVIFVSERSPMNNIKGKHINNVSSVEYDAIVQYIGDKGFQLGESEIFKEKLGYAPKPDEVIINKGVKEVTVEKSIVKGVKNDNISRDKLNAMYFVDLGKSVPEWPWPIKFKKIGFI